MKKILSILLAMCMLFAMFALPATAADTVTCVLHIGNTTQEISGAVGDVIKFPMPFQTAADMGKHFVTWCTDEACENPLMEDPTFTAGETVHYYAWLKDFTTYYRDDFDSVTKGDTVIQYAHDQSGNESYYGYTMPLYGKAAVTGTGVYTNYSTSWSPGYLFMKDTDGAYVNAAPDTTYHMTITYRVPNVANSGKLTIKPVFGLNTQYVGRTDMNNQISQNKQGGTAIATITETTDGWVTKDIDFTTGGVQMDSNGVMIDKWVPNIGFSLEQAGGTVRLEVDSVVVQTYKTVKFDFIEAADRIDEKQLYGADIDYPDLAEGSVWSLDPDKYVEAPATVGEDSITVYEFNENAATRYPVNFVYANGDTVTEQYVEGATIVYPELAPSSLNTTDNVWSGSANAWTAVPEKMGTEDITVYEYKNPVMSFENYNQEWWPSGKAPNNAHISTDCAYSGETSMEIYDLNVRFLTSEPGDWSTNWKNYYEYDAETDNITQLSGDAAPTFDKNKHCEYYTYTKSDQATFIIPVNLGPTQGKTYTYKYKVSFMYYAETDRPVWIYAKQANIKDVNYAWQSVNVCTRYMQGAYRDYLSPVKNTWTEKTIEIAAEDLCVVPDGWGNQAVILKFEDNWGSATEAGAKTIHMYIDDVKVEPIIEEVSVNLNRYTTAGNVTETLTGKPGETLTLPATNFFMDENWYTADGEVYTGTEFPEEDLNLYTAGAFVDNDSNTFGPNYDVVKDGEDYAIYYAGTDAQVTGKDNALPVGQVKDYTTYKVAVTYKANGGDLGFNAYTAQAGNRHLGTMPVNGTYTGNIYTITDSTDGYETAVFYISTDLYGEYTAVAGKEDTKTIGGDQLYLTVQDTGASELYIKDIVLTEVDGVKSAGVAKLGESVAENLGWQAIRFFFNYNYEIVGEDIYVVLGDESYKLVGRGFIYMNGNEQALGTDNAFTLNSAYDNMVVFYKDTDLNECWDATEDVMTFSTFVNNFTDEYLDDEVMVKGYVTILVDGQEMVIYSDTISRSVGAVVDYTRV